MDNTEEEKEIEQDKTYPILYMLTAIVVTIVMMINYTKKYNWLYLKDQDVRDGLAENQSKVKNLINLLGVLPYSFAILKVAKKNP